MKRRFLTSCDANFAARVITMIESLWRWSPGAEITVLCLDDRIGPILLDEWGERVSLVSIATLVAAEPRLPALREQRQAWEFYATLKPVLLGWALERSPEGQVLAFADSDTCFFSNPEPLFEEMGTASIGISPHRFDDSSAGLTIYGEFNAGFGIWRNDSIGRQCLSDWRADCLDWCFCRVEGSRFMNQGYLSSWSGRYGNVAILQHPGENLGPWNVGSHRLESGPDGILVDGQPLVFFHFSGIFRGVDGRWKIHDHWPALRQLPVMREIFGPYLAAVDRAARRLAARIGSDPTGSVRCPDPSKPVLDLMSFGATDTESSGGPDLS